MVIVLGEAASPTYPGRVPRLIPRVRTHLSLDKDHTPRDGRSSLPHSARPSRFPKLVARITASPAGSAILGLARPPRHRLTPAVLVVLSDRSWRSPANPVPTWQGRRRTTRTPALAPVSGVSRACQTSPDAPIKRAGHGFGMGRVGLIAASGAVGELVVVVELV